MMFGTLVMVCGDTGYKTRQALRKSQCWQEVMRGQAGGKKVSMLQRRWFPTAEERYVERHR